MLEVLKQVELVLPELLTDPNDWNSAYIDYEEPHVSRIWRQWGDYRIYLHRIHACVGKPLWHPHPWPQAVRVVIGSYEMGMGWGKENPKQSVTIQADNGMAYEMTDPDCWHYVKPLDPDSVFSLMVTGKPWDRPTPKSNKAFRKLDDDEFKYIFKYFRNQYLRKDEMAGLFIGRMSNGIGRERQ